ncbi:MAG: hypothetical protein RLZZ21_262 [Planctomycetota bacterium]
MKRIDFDRMIQALVLVRLGQELGTDSQLAKSVATACEMAQKLAAFFLVDKF